MSPKLVTLKEVIAGKDMDECARVESGRGVEPREGGDIEFGIGRDDAGRELSPGKASGAAISDGRGERPDTSARGWGVESCAAHGRTGAGVGARAREVQRPGGRAIWADPGPLSIWRAKTASRGRQRYVPLTRRLTAALAEHRHLRSKRVFCQDDRTPFTRQIVQNRMILAARRANVRRGVHILRHTFCSHLSMRGAPPKAIQELAGHADLTMTQRYMHLSPAALDAAIGLLDRPSGEQSCGDMLATGSPLQK